MHACYYLKGTITTGCSVTVCLSSDSFSSHTLLYGPAFGIAALHCHLPISLLNIRETVPWANPARCGLAWTTLKISVNTCTFSVQLAIWSKLYFKWLALFRLLCFEKRRCMQFSLNLRLYWGSSTFICQGHPQFKSRWRLCVSLRLLLCLNPSWWSWLWGVLQIIF